LQDGTINGDEIAFGLPMMDDAAKVTGKVKGEVITLT
jgi:hypothetical protein